MEGERCRRLTATKAAFFSLFFGYIVVGAYASLLFDAKGFTPFQIGLLCDVCPLSVLVVVPVVSYVAETRSWQAHMQVGGAALGAALFAGMCLSGSKPLIAALTVAFNAVFMPVLPLFDEHSMAVVERREDWGGYRSFGAYGWAIAAPVASLVIGYGGWEWAPLIFIAGLLPFVACVLRTPVPKVASDHHLRDVLAFVVQRRRLWNYLAAVCAMGMGYVLIATFLFLFLQDLGAPPALPGLCLVFTVVVEIPLFRYSAWLHARFTNRQLLLGAMCGWVVRVTGYSFLTNPWAVLLLEPFHGMTFGLMWLAGVNVFSTAFPPHLSNSAFGVLHAAAFGLGPLVGNLVGGVLYGSLGARWMFRCAAVAMLAAAAAFHVIERRFEVAEGKAVPDVVPEEIVAPDAVVAPAVHLVRSAEAPVHPEAAAELPVAA